MIVTFRSMDVKGGHEQRYGEDAIREFVHLKPRHSGGARKIAVRCGPGRITTHAERPLGLSINHGRGFVQSIGGHPTLNMMVRSTASRITQPPHAENAAMPHGSPPKIETISATIHAVLIIQNKMHSMVTSSEHAVVAAHRIAQRMKRPRPMAPMAAPTIHTQRTAIHTPITTTMPPRRSRMMARTSRTPQPADGVPLVGHVGTAKVAGAGGMQLLGIAGPLTDTPTT